MEERPHHLRVAARDESWDAEPVVTGLRERVEPWLSGVLGSEHLCVLIGNGLTTAASFAAGGAAPSMDASDFNAGEAAKVQSEAERVAARSGRGQANIEDQLRAALT